MPTGNVQGTPPFFPSGGSGGGGGNIWGSILPAAIGGGSSLLASWLASSGQRGASRTAEELAQEEIALRRAVLAMIGPFANQLIQLGIDPAKFASSPLGQSILGQGRQAISGEFDQARVNLIDALAGSGISPGSGLGAAPLANMFSSEAAEQARLTSQLPLQGLQLGLQGAGILQGLPSSAGGIGGLLGVAGQPSLFSQSMANLPGAIAAAINQYNQSRQQQNQIGALLAGMQTAPSAVPGVWGNFGVGTGG